MLPALVLNATLAAIGSEPGIYSNCATVALSAASGPVTESNTANNRACAVTTAINSTGCAESGQCPQPTAVCKQDVLMLIDASVSIGAGGLPTVKTAIGKFLQAMQNKGGSVNILSFNNGGIGTNNPSWTAITSGWTPVTNLNLVDARKPDRARRDADQLGRRAEASFGGHSIGAIATIATTVRRARD